MRPIRGFREEGQTLMLIRGFREEGQTLRGEEPVSSSLRQRHCCVTPQLVFRNDRNHVAGSVLLDLLEWCSPLGVSGAPLGLSGAPLGLSGAPLGLSGAPLG